MKKLLVVLLMALVVSMVVVGWAETMVGLNHESVSKQFWGDSWRIHQQYFPPEPKLNLNLAENTPALILLFSNESATEQKSETEQPVIWAYLFASSLSTSHPDLYVCPKCGGYHAYQYYTTNVPTTNVSGNNVELFSRQVYEFRDGKWKWETRSGVEGKNLSFYRWERVERSNPYQHYQKIKKGYSLELFGGFLTIE